MKKDPVENIEHMIKELHDTAGKYTQPVLHRYPLLFLFLVTFSAAAITQGFKELIHEVPYFVAHPGVLMFIGVVVLLLTGKLYKSLGGKGH